MYLNDLTASFLDTFGKEIDDTRTVLVVFIDDLDRCHEGKIIDVLEGIKLFLDQQGCIFILGVDRPVIEGAVATRFGEEKKSEYLDKIIQVNFNLPPLRPGDITRYIEELNRDGRIHPDLDQYLPIIREHIEKNPRTVKRFVNDLSFHLSLAGNLDLLLTEEGKKEGVEPRIEPAHLVRWNVLVYSFPDFSRLVLGDPGVIAILRQFLPSPGVDEEEALKGAPSYLQPFLRNKKLLGLLENFPSDKRLVEIFVHQSRSTERIEIATPVGREGFQTPEIGQMVKIPSGEFLYGDDKVKHGLSEYYIDVYLVTNGEYKKFVEAGGYDQRECWTEEGWKWIQKEGHTKPRFWDDEKYEAFNKPDHPVVGVSWFEAWAYAGWAKKRLPTELEWEKAARGVDGRDYPWGDTFDRSRCNTAESGIGSTTPVNRFESGSSPYGCHDMAGNAWEWTHSLYKPYPYNGEDGREDPKAKGAWVLRGGSWYVSAERARASTRGRIAPAGRYGYLGFRCAKTP